jgi:hypothetical protein
MGVVLQRFQSFCLGAIAANRRPRGGNRTLEPQQNDALGTAGTLGSFGTRFYLGAILNAPSSRITSPFSISFSRM